MAGACLDPRLLSDYLAGRTSGPAVNAVIEEHLQECEKCQARAAQHRPHRDSLYQALAQVGSLKVASVEPELVGALSAIASMQPAGAGQELPGRSGAGQFIRDYQLLEKLGEGGMGAVYLAMHTWLDKPVAVKLLKSDRNQDPQAVSRFEREMRAVGKLEHPHIVRALDAGQENGVHFLVMEYVSGVDLSRLVQRLGPLAVADACELVRQAALGLHHAHENELIHRDVKPSNLMLTSEGQLKVLDLGLAQFRPTIHDSFQLTRDNQVLGTLLYISPEQLGAGGQVDHRSDIYSLGVTLCELLLGAEPLRRGLAPAVTFQTPAAPARRDVPEGLWSLVQRMVAQEKFQRPSTMHEVALTLAAWAPGADLTGLLSRLAPASSGTIFNALGGSAASASAAPHSHSQTAVRPTTDIVPPPLPPPLSGAARGTALTVARPTALIHVPARRRQLTAAGWIAAAVVALAALTPALWLASKLFTSGPKVPVPSIPQTGILTINPKNTLLADLLDREELAVVDQAGNAKPLRAGENRLAAGTYTIQCRSSEVVLADAQPMEVKPGTTIAPPRLQVQLPSSWKVPEIPQPGSLSVYEGTLWHGRPGAAADEPKQPIPYGLTLAALADEPVGKKPCRWLRVEIDNKSDPQGLQETAYLLVDVERWKSGQPLSIDHGWIVANSGSIDDWWKANGSDASFPGLVARFDPRSDTLEEAAGRHGIPLFEQRIKVHDALAMVFNADLSGASLWARTFRASMPPNPVLRIESYDGPRGSIPSVRISARGGLEGPVPGTSPLEALFNVGARHQVALDVQRSSTVPFSFLQLKAHSPLFEATMKLGNSVTGGAEVASLPPEKSLAEFASRDREKARARLPFDRASFPKDGGEVRHHVTIEFAGKKLSYYVKVRCVGTVPMGADTGRWLEIEVESRGAEAEHEEQARVLVNESKYVRDGALTVERGWLVVCGETFPFDPAGNLEPVRQGLHRLEKENKEKKLPPSPIGEPLFGIHAVLSMMFNADLKAARQYGALRARFSEAITKVGLKRKPETGVKLTRRNFETVTGTKYKVEADNLSYEMEKTTNDQIPFEFRRVTMTAQVSVPVFTVMGEVPVHLNVEEEGSRSDATPALSEESELIDRVAQTQKRIEETYGKNWRQWTIASDPPEKMWAEYCGMRKGNTTVLLRDDDQKFRLVSLDQLSAEDQRQAKEGRYWTDSSGRPIAFKDDPASYGVRLEFVKLITRPGKPSWDDSFVVLSDGKKEDRAAVDGKYLSLRDFSDDDRSAIGELWTPTAVLRGTSTPAGPAKAGSRRATPAGAAAAAPRPASTAPAAKPARRSIFESIGSAVTSGVKKTIGGLPVEK